MMLSSTARALMKMVWKRSLTVMLKLPMAGPHRATHIACVGPRRCSGAIHRDRLCEKSEDSACQPSPVAAGRLGGSTSSSDCAMAARRPCVVSLLSSRFVTCHDSLGACSVPHAVKVQGQDRQPHQVCCMAQWGVCTHKMARALGTLRTHGAGWGSTGMGASSRSTAATSQQHPSPRSIGHDASTSGTKLGVFESAWGDKGIAPS